MTPAEVSWPDPPIVVAIIAAMGVAMGAWLTWLASGASRLQARVEDLEAKYASMWEARERDAIVKRQLGDHLDLLEHHIWTGQPPPPPPRPAGV